MLNQNCLMVIQQYFSKARNRDFVYGLKKEGYSDTNVFEDFVLLSLGSFGLKKVLVTVQTKEPVLRKDLDYHVWIRPISLETYLGMSNTFKHIDEVYMLVNGGSDYSKPAVEADNTLSW
jgi:hypothetical protein